MTMQKKYIEDKDGNIVLPITHQSAVKDSNGTPLDTIITNIQNAATAEASRASAAESALSSGKADKATTLSGYGITDAYTKSETYTKTEVNNLITTPNQEYVSVTATAQTTAVTDVLPATGAADTTYRVGNWDGTQYNDSVFSEYAWDGSAYIKLSTKSQIGEVYDISANHADTKYADLAAALGTNGANIPQSLQKGGMSIKFVQSSDNKYVQYRLMSTSFNTTRSNWQGVDEEPTAGSENLVKSYKLFHMFNNLDSFLYCAYVTIYTKKILFNTTNRTITIPKDTTITYKKTSSYYPADDIEIALTQSNYGLIVFNSSDKTFRDANISHPNLIKEEFILFSYSFITKLLSLDDNTYLVDGNTPNGLKESFDNYIEELVDIVLEIGSNAYIDVNTLEITPYNTYRVTKPFYVEEGQYVTVKNISGVDTVLIGESNSEGTTVSRAILKGTTVTPIEYTFVSDKNMYILLSYSYAHSNPSVTISTPGKLYNEIHEIQSDLHNVEETVNSVEETVNDIISQKDKELIPIFASLKTSILLNGRKDSTYSPLTLLWTTDTHGYLKGLSDFTNIKRKYSNYIDDAILTGDMAPSKWGDYNESSHNNIDGYNAILKQIGNHDVYDYNNTGNNSDYAPDTAKYNRYFNGIANWNVVQPEGVNDNESPYYCACFYYKDYISANIRLIMLDCMNWTTIQNSWFISVLSDAATKGLHVICSQHIPQGQLSGFDSSWNSKAYEAHGESQNNIVLTDVDDFISSGGRFICWLYGHMHIDICGVHSSHPNQLYIGMTCAATPNGAWDELARPIDTYAEFVSNVLSVDYKDTKIRVYRIGANIDKNLSKREVLCLDYTSHNIVFER